MDLSLTGDPLLRSSDDPVLSIFRQGRSGLDTSDVTSCKGLADCQGDELLPREDLRNDFLLELFTAKVYDLAVQ